MTALPHPGWCHPSACTAYPADPYVARVHRSKAIPVDLGSGEVLLAYLAQPIDQAATMVELVVIERPVPDHHWWGAEPLAALTLPVGPADVVRHALTSLVRAAAA
jgi:hypothetical protein